MNPSLLIIPDRYKAAKLYSQLPDSGAGDFDVTRSTTATRVNASGLIESVASGVPRIDYTGGGCGKLLVEPAATNLLLYSEEFDDAYWAKSSATVTANDGIAPDGTTTAEKVTLTADSGRVSRSITLTADTQFTISVFIKNIDATNSIVNMRCNNNADTTANALFVLSGSGSISAQSNAVASIASFGNGWYRCAITFNSESGVASPIVRIVSNALGTGFTTGESVFIWGAQLETGSVATSYIPTVAATVTRNADVISLSSASGLIGQTEGTIYAEVDVSKLLGTQSRYILNISDGTADNRIYVAFSGASSNILRARVWSEGVLEATIDTSTISALGTYKLAIGYANNDIVFYLNGVQVGTDTSATIPACSSVNLGSSQGNVAQFNDRISAAALYTTRLSDSELIALTTL